MSMDDEVYDAYHEAGALANKLLNRAASMVKEGASLLEMVEAVEAMVVEEGAILAFPLNVSFNEAAAHDTAMPGDERVFSRGDLVKVDLGVAIDGYIADTAMTVDLGDHGALVEASRAALEAAIAAVRRGRNRRTGAAIQAAIEERGYQSVANLRPRPDHYNLHGSPMIPNVAISGGASRRREWLRTELFATTGRTGPEAPRGDLPTDRRLPGPPFAGGPRSSPAAPGPPVLPPLIPGTRSRLAGHARPNGILHPPVLHDEPGSLSRRRSTP